MELTLECMLWCVDAAAVPVVAVCAVMAAAASTAGGGSGGGGVDAAARINESGNEDAVVCLDGGVEVMAVEAEVTTAEAAGATVRGCGTGVEVAERVTTTATTGMPAV